MFRKRASGILLHISSLPSEFGIGDLGPQAYQFVDFLKQANQTYWQMLPFKRLLQRCPAMIFLRWAKSWTLKMRSGGQLK